MSRNILWCYPEETLKDALEKMGEEVANVVCFEK